MCWRADAPERRRGARVLWLQQAAGVGRPGGSRRALGRLASRTLCTQGRLAHSLACSLARSPSVPRTLVPSYPRLVPHTRLDRRLRAPAAALALAPVRRHARMAIHPPAITLISAPAHSSSIFDFTHSSHLEARTRRSQFYTTHTPSRTFFFLPDPGAPPRDFRPPRKPALCALPRPKLPAVQCADVVAGHQLAPPSARQ